MYYFNRSTGEAVEMTGPEVMRSDSNEWDTRNDFLTFEDAKYVAFKATSHEANYGDPMVEYMAIDNGRGVSPRYDVIRVPQEGDPVSKAFNGDYYPEGYIVKVSPSRKVVTTSTGEKFYRVRETGSWRANRTWFMVGGHVDKRNPSF